MKTWMKVLMWLGLGGGIGFFAGYQVGQKSGRKDAETQDAQYTCTFTGLKDSKTAYDDYAKIRGINHDLNVYRGGDYDGDVCLEEDAEMPEEEPVIPEPEGLEEEIPQMHPQDMVPELIDFNQFCDNPWGYNQEILRYYRMDKVLYNLSTGSVIDNPDQVVGVGTLYAFDSNAGYRDAHQLGDVIFVRNDTMGTLFRIDRLDTASDDIVDGIGSPDYEEEADDDTE